MNDPFGPKPRDLSQFHETSEGPNHLENQMRKRNIGWFEVKKDLQEGTVEEASKPHQVRYRLSFPGPDLLVVVDGNDGKVVTAFYSDQQGAVGGGI